jgi:hypothetical protein
VVPDLLFGRIDASEAASNLDYVQQQRAPVEF